MNTRAAFDAIQGKLSASAGTNVIDSFYDEKLFGNFWITYKRDSGCLSVVNDRGQLILNSGPADGQLEKVLVDDLYTADAATVRNAIS
jgi:hypothetical protein